MAGSETTGAKVIPSRGIHPLFSLEFSPVFPERTVFRRTYLLHRRIIGQEFSWGLTCFLFEGSVEGVFALETR